MEVVAPTKETAQHRKEFFQAVFDQESGYIGLMAISKDKKPIEAYFHYPEELDEANDWIDKYHINANIYFCAQLLREGKRIKATVKTCTCVWADLDFADYTKITPPPSIVVESSPKRYHGYWLLKESADPATGEDASHRLAYTYRELGVDQGGWDLTQLLRVPLTYNLKYTSTTDTPVVKIIKFDTEKKYDIEGFLSFFAPVPGGYEVMPVPAIIPDIDADTVLKKYEGQLPNEVATLFLYAPDKDWSAVLWKLECLLVECGLSREETYIVAREAACNKYERDHRAQEALWTEVCKAFEATHDKEKGFSDYLKPNLPKKKDFLTDEERESISNDYFTDTYVDWAKGITDAEVSFHKLGAFIILSLILSRGLRIHTKLENMPTNIWGMILADTTVSRKTTSMRMAMRFIKTIVPEVFVASDGSMEGIAEAIAVRPGEPSLFLRDEFSGLLINMQNSKHHQANLMQFFSNLYDGDSMKRKLRNREVNIIDPLLIVFGGGIKNKILELADSEAVGSGFFPRFIFALADDDVIPDDSNYSSLRPSDVIEDMEPTHISGYLDKLNQVYSDTTIIRLKGGANIASPKTWLAKLTNETWDRYDQLDKELGRLAYSSSFKDVLAPSLKRLSVSILKCSALLAASRTIPPTEEGITVEIGDLLKAIAYGEEWVQATVEVCTRVGFTVGERKIEKIWNAIKKEEGIGRAVIMRNYRLSAKEADLILATMEQRGMIVRKKRGKGELLYTPDFLKDNKDDTL